MSFQITLKPNRRAAARFIGDVRRAILKAYVEEQKVSGLSQTEIARALDVHRSVINRELRGTKDMTLGRVAELAWACKRKPKLLLESVAQAHGANMPQPNAPAATAKVSITAGSTEVDDVDPTPKVRFRARAA